MGIGTLFKSFFNSEALGDQTIDTTMTIYSRAQRQQPNEEPHAWLASTWLNRMKSLGKSIDSPEMHMMAFNETFLHACVKPPLCARSLGLFFLYKENPHVLQEHSKFSKEYESLMGPVIEAQENGSIQELYKKYNPEMAAESEGKD